MLMKLMFICFWEQFLIWSVILWALFNFFGKLANLVHLADVFNRFWMMNVYVSFAYMLCEYFLFMHASCLNTKPLVGAVLWYTVCLYVGF